MLLRICSGRVVPPDPATHPTMTVDDVRYLSSSKLVSSDSLWRALLLQNALGALETRPGSESFRDPEMSPRGRQARGRAAPQPAAAAPPPPPTSPVADPVTGVVSYKGAAGGPVPAGGRKRAAAEAGRDDRSPKAPRFALFSNSAPAAPAGPPGCGPTTSYLLCP